MRLREMDERTTFMQQLREQTRPIVLINEFNVAPDDVERFLEVWADDAAFMKQQPVSSRPSYIAAPPGARRS